MLFITSMLQKKAKYIIQVIGLGCLLNWGICHYWVACWIERFCHCIVFFCISLYCVVSHSCCISLHCLKHIVLHCTRLHCMAWYCIASYRVVLYRIVMYHVVSNHIVSFYFIVSYYCIVSYHIVLHVLYYTVLNCVVLCYVVVYCFYCIVCIVLWFRIVFPYCIAKHFIMSSCIAWQYHQGHVECGCGQQVTTPEGTSLQYSYEYTAVTRCWLPTLCYWEAAVHIYE